MIDECPYCGNDLKIGGHRETCKFYTSDKPTDRKDISTPNRVHELSEDLQCVARIIRADGFTPLVDKVNDLAKLLADYNVATLEELKERLGES